MASSQSHNYHLHFLLVPYLAPSHTIPMINMANLLAQQQNVTATILTTPLNAIRYQKHINSDLPVRFLELPFPGTENGLPEGCESAESLPGPHLFPKFSAAVNMLQERLEQKFESLNPRPHCIISDKFVSRSEDTALTFNIPRITFDGMSCFKQLSTHYLSVHNTVHEIPESETFVLPDLPDRIEMTRAQLTPEFSHKSIVFRENFKRLRESESRSYGMVVNSFEELEGEYVKEFNKLKRGKVWCLGPLSLYNDNDLGCGSDDDQRYLKWLDSKEHGSVVYACFGSSSQMIPAQLIELGLALEAAKSPFIWVVRAGERAKEVEKWLLESGFEKRIKDRGLLIREWAPQVLILWHPSVGGFLTHCGWSSTLEGVCAGVPMITWPQFAEQFLNEKLIVQVLGIGVSIGATVMVHWGQEEKYGVTVKSEQVKTAIEQVMRAGSEGDERRKKAKALGVAAKKAIEEGGSSHNNVTLLIQDIWELTNVRSQKSLT